ncbi:Spermidine/putrescine-binding periplasmic protein [Agrobacterium tumefaciens str. Kerr 14]|uniref:Spermidine/putrescine-binding periplasmic protein n=1 Tax=Agrobacterium tumefaciens str. Kerr 14 TaxID=1183424 RepID=A0A1S7SAW7_AGRTU|nr:ABC transporter substrate-binding protein [Agrobacterium tumefaciens]CUX65676.1 Spermidine/putrescine-binding periplasmic protein [Agrobacterium tumefaciens str. Kerr 14]
MLGVKRRVVATLCGTSLAMFAAGAPLANAASVTIAAYGGIFQDGYIKAVIKPFEAANPDIKVQYYQMNNSAQTLGTIRGMQAAPQVSVAIMDVTVAKAGTDEGLFEPLDETNMPVLKDLYPAARIEGVAGPAVTFDSAALMYSPERVTPAPTSWNVLLDKKYDQRIATTGIPSLETISLLLIFNKMNGKEDYKTSLEAGWATIEKMAPLVLTWDPRPDPATFITNGTADLGVGWNARSQVYAERSNGKLAVASLDEGTALQVNTITLIKNAPDQEAAKKFIAYALSPEAQKAFTEEMYYAPTNQKTQVSEKAIARTVAAPDKMAKVIDVNWLEVAKLRDGIIRDWRRRGIAK